MNRALIYAFLIGILIFLPTILFAEAGQRFNVDGYSLHISATKLSNKLVIRGSVKGGDSCKNLQVYCYLIDENGRTDRIIAVLKNYSHSKKFSFKKKLANSGGNRWTVSDVSIFK